MKYLLCIIFLLINSFSFDAAADDFKIGVIIPLSGIIADFGIAAKNGTELAQRHQEKSGNNGIQFIFEDSVYEAKNTISAFHKLHAENKVNLVFVWGSTPSAAVASIAEQKKVPTLVFTGDPEVTLNKTYVIDVADRLETYGKIQLEYLRSKGYKKLGVVKAEIQYLEGLLKGMQSNLEDDESITIIDSLLPEATLDLSNTVLKTKQAISREKLDALGVFLVTGQISSFYQKLAQQNIKLPTFGSDFLLQQEENLKAGKLIIGSTFPTIGVSQSFIDIYRKNYANTAQMSYAGYSYDVTRMLYKLFSGKGSNLSADEVLLTIENAKPTKGVTGKLKFIHEDPKIYKNPGRRFSSPILIKSVQKDGSVRILN